MNRGGFNVHIINCTFKSNSGYAVCCYSDYVTIEDSNFENSYIAVQAYDRPLIVNNCNFVNNYYAAIQATKSTISNSNFTNNGNLKNGQGAIYSSGIKISNSIFENNVQLILAELFSPNREPH